MGKAPRKPTSPKRKSSTTKIKSAKKSGSRSHASTMGGKSLGPNKLLRAHIEALEAHTIALRENTAALVAIRADAHRIVYLAMGIPVSADRATTDAINIADTPFANFSAALTDRINRQIDAAGLPISKHVGLPAIIACADKTIGHVVVAVKRAIAR